MSDCLSFISSLWFLGGVRCWQVQRRRPCACADLINLYRAAPLRLALLLHARLTAREGWGSSWLRQIGYARLLIPITATHPTRPTHPKERRKPCLRHLDVICCSESRPAARGHAQESATAQSPAFGRPQRS